MKTADRALAEGMRAPFSLKSHPRAAREWEVSSCEIRGTLASCPVLVADNVAAYTRARDTEYLLEEFPCLAPPWPVFWIEYPSVSGKQRRVAYVRDATEDKRSVEGSYQGAINDAHENGFEGEPRWVLDIAMLLEDEQHRVIGPVGWMVLVLDDRGMCVGNRWVLGTPQGPEVVDEFRLHNGNRFNEMWLLAAMLPTLQTLAFLHCRNMVTDRVDPPAKLSAKHKRLHGRPLLRYQQVRLEVPRRVQNGRGTGSGELGPPSLHIVAGHFSHYGDCHPPRPWCVLNEHTFAPCRTCGGHTPHGLLFGKHEGLYWLSQTSRGDPARGEVKTDFEVVVKP